MHIIKYIISFGLGRGGLFFSPLLLANLLPAAAYGSLEAALAIASVVTSVVTLGAASGVPLVLLGHNVYATMKGIIFHHLVVVGICFFVLICGVILNWPQYLLLTAILTGGLAIQRLAGVHFKTQGLRDESVLIEAGLLVLMALSAVFSFYVGLNIEYSVWVAAGSYVFVLIILYIRYFFQPEIYSQKTSWVATLFVGIPLMLGGMVSLLATTSGRLGMGILAESELTAQYAVLARAAAIPMVAHQLIVIAKFRNLFKASDEDVALISLKIILFVAFSSLIFLLLSPFLGYVFGSAFMVSFAANRDAGFNLSAQSILWSAIALNDLVIARHQIMQKILPFTVVSLGIFLIIGYKVLMYSGITVNNFAIIHGVVMLAFYCAQSFIMLRMGLYLKSAWVASIASYSMLIALNYLAK